MAGISSSETSTAVVQRRTLRVLFATQIASGMGYAVGSSVGALLAAELAGVGLSGLAQSAAVVGGALAAIPATAIVHRHGRRPSLAAAYGVGTLGAVTVVLAVIHHSLPSLFLGYFLFGGATAANLQARYTAVDLAPADRRGRHLALIVWATTIGAVAGPPLAAPAGIALAPYGIPPLAAPYAFSALLFIITAITLLALLRPDPALLAGTAGGSGERRRLRDGLRAVLARPPAVLGITAVAVGHIVMVGIMAMTPVHIRSAGHDAAHTLRIVGVVISVHVAGMYAFAPVIGWLTDRIGRRSVIFAGILLLLAGCALAGGAAGFDNVRLGAGLFTVGLGWSCTMVGGSTLLTETVPLELRASAQGLSDLVMGLAGASAGALSGVVVSAWEYSGLAWVAAIATLPLALLLVHQRRIVTTTR